MAISPLDLLFPRTCLGCGKTGLYFCADCASKIRLIKKQICPVCGKMAIGGETHSSCRNGLSLDGLLSIFAYQDIIRAAIKVLKYKFVTDLAESLMEVAARDFDFFLREGIVVPVPLSPQRKNWRGFNQSEFLGKIFARKNNLGFNHQVLERVVDTPPQVGLSSRQRQVNVRDAFRVADRRLIKGKVLIVFDDVWTTGATLASCSQILKKEGAEKVWGVTLAR